jgi:hypothetical protein
MAKYKVHLTRVHERMASESGCVGQANCTNSNQIFGEVIDTVNNLMTYLQPLLQKWSITTDTYRQISKTDVPDLREERERAFDYDFIVVRDFMDVVDYCFQIVPFATMVATRYMTFSRNLYNSLIVPTAAPKVLSFRGEIALYFGA